MARLVLAFIAGLALFAVAGLQQPAGTLHTGKAFRFNKVKEGVYHAVGTGALTVVGNSSIIVNDNVRDDIHAFPEPLQQQFWAYVSACTTPVLDLTDASYLRIEVDRITRPAPDRQVCGGGVRR